MQPFWVVLFSASIARLPFGDLDATNDGVGFRSYALVITVAVFLQLVGIPGIAITSTKNYGGGMRYAVSVVLRFILKTVQVPTFSVVIPLFLCNFLRGKSITWDAQNRYQLGLSWIATFHISLATDSDRLRDCWLVRCSGRHAAALGPAHDRWIVSSSAFHGIHSIVALEQYCHKLGSLHGPGRSTIPPVLSSLVAPGIVAAAAKEKPK